MSGDPLEERDVQKIMDALDDARVQNKVLAIIGSRLEVSDGVRTMILRLLPASKT